MLGTNIPAVLVSAVGAFIIGALWYSPRLFGKTLLTLRGLDPCSAARGAHRRAGWEFARCLIISVVLADLMTVLSRTTLGSGLVFTVWIWVAMYTMLAGAVLHEGYCWRPYARSHSRKCYGNPPRG